MKLIKENSFACVSLVLQRAVNGRGISIVQGDESFGSGFLIGHRTVILNNHFINTDYSHNFLAISSRQRDNTKTCCYQVISVN